MKYLPIDERDAALIDAASAILRDNYLAGKHHVGAAVRAGSGRIYTGVHLNSSAIDVCAEWVALGTAASNGERVFETIVAVQMGEHGEPNVCSPCGVCRELLRYYGDAIGVLFVEDGAVKKCRAADLLPGAYRRPPKSTRS